MAAQGATIILCDNAPVAATDLGTHFISPSSLGLPYASAFAPRFSEAMPNARVLVHAGDPDEALLSRCDLAIFADHATISRAQLIRFNEFCRAAQPPIGFIAAETHGLAGSLFVDFGPEFLVAHLTTHTQPPRGSPRPPWRYLHANITHPICSPSGSGLRRCLTLTGPSEWRKQTC